MSKTITDSQLIGELGEAATRKQFLRMGIQIDFRSRLEAGIDAIAELMLDGEPTARMVAVQVKSTQERKYASETKHSFSYRLKQNDLNYWRNSNLPVIIVLYRLSDESFYWKHVSTSDRKLTFNKKCDRLDGSALERLMAIAVPKQQQGFFVPPIGCESAIINILPVFVPDELFVATTPFSPKKACAILHDASNGKRFDWTIQESTFWAFHDPRQEATRSIVDLDQVEAIETSLIADHEEISVQNQFSYLLRLSLAHQFHKDLCWDKDHGLFYFRSLAENQARDFSYKSATKKTSARVVSVYPKKDGSDISYVRHHAFEPRFERLCNQWYLIISPTYFFTTNGYFRHPYPHALLSGKKRADNNSSFRGQVIMWHRFLSQQNPRKHQSSLFPDDSSSRILVFGKPPSVELSARVPEHAWHPAKSIDANRNQEKLDIHVV